jgi:hypothetical protein
MAIPAKPIRPVPERDTVVLAEPAIPLLSKSLEGGLRRAHDGFTENVQ